MTLNEPTSDDQTANETSASLQSTGSVSYGIIGTGMMGLEHIANLDALDGAVVSAIADPEPISRQRATELMPGVASFADYQDLLADDSCDAYVIATPNHTHFPIIKAVMKTGKPVLIEKPLCISVEECQEVVDLARDYPNPVWIGLEYRYMAPVAKLLEEVAKGSVGQVKMIAIREHRFPFLPKFQNWNRFSANSGGTLVEKCCHFFDLMTLIADSTPERIYASGGQDVNHLNETYDGKRSDILDNAFVIIDYANGVRASLDLCMFAEATRNQEEISVVGDQGKVEALIPDDIVRIGRRGTDTIGTVQDQIVRAEVPYEGFHHGSSFIEHQLFRRAIQTGEAAQVNAMNGLLSVAVGVAAQLSIQEGRPVRLNEVWTG